jgi:large subunit ribosomal protein L15
MKLHKLSPVAGSVKYRKRIGRGEGSTRGGTSTRGNKGAQSRSGYSKKIGFEGGQMPLQRRVPKFGFKNPNRVAYTPINIDVIQELVDKHGVTEFTQEVFVAHGLSSKNSRIKILGRGELNTSVNVHAHAFSSSATEAIENKGGSATKL